MRKEVYPKNKQLFKKLIPFAKRIISICKENNISLVIYGSFAHFYHTKDKNMKVSDIDVYVPEDSFEKIIRVLKQKKINYKYIPKWHILRIEKGKLKVELDSIDFWYKDTNNKSLPRNFNKINFYGIETEVIALKNLVAVYLSAYKGSTDNKERIIKKIKHLEKFFEKGVKK